MTTRRVAAKCITCGRGSPSRWRRTDLAGILIAEPWGGSKVYPPLRGTTGRACLDKCRLLSPPRNRPPDASTPGPAATNPCREFPTSSWTRTAIVVRTGGAFSPLSPPMSRTRCGSGSRPPTGEFEAAACPTASRARRTSGSGRSAGCRCSSPKPNGVRSPRASSSGPSFWSASSPTSMAKAA